MGRLFVVAELDDSIERYLSEVVGRLSNLFSQKIRWVPRENRHLTLTFIGEVDERQTLEVIDGIKLASLGIPRFIVGIDGLITFPQQGNPRILALRVLDESRWLSWPKRKLETRLVDLGLEIEPRAFSPHITVGRLRDDFLSHQGEVLDNLKKLVDQIGYQAVAVDGISLNSSTLTREGALYIREESIKFVSWE